MSDGKTIILNRIREALRNNPAPRPYPDHGPLGIGKPHSAPSVQTCREWLPKVGATREEQIALFALQSEALKTEFYRCATIGEARQIFSKLVVGEGWKRVATHDAPDNVALLEGATVETLYADKGYAVDALESCDAGVTCCECLVAQTGGVMVSVASAGGRALSVLPPHHIVIARSSQILPDLTAAFDLVKQRYGKNLPSFLSFITGPSRTGDIERILVLGAHGPKRLTVLMIED